MFSIIWNNEGSVAANYASLQREEDKSIFVKDFQSAADWLISWNKDDLTEDDLRSLAAEVISERESAS